MAKDSLQVGSPAAAAFTAMAGPGAGPCPRGSNPAIVFSMLLHALVLLLTLLGANGVPGQDAAGDAMITVELIRTEPEPGPPDPEPDLASDPPPSEPSAKPPAEPTLQESAPLEPVPSVPALPEPVPAKPVLSEPPPPVPPRREEPLRPAKPKRPARAKVAAPVAQADVSPGLPGPPSPAPAAAPAVVAVPVPVPALSPPAEDPVHGYGRLVWSRISQRRPRGLTRRGSALVTFTLSPEGSLVSVILSRSSGSAMLDQAALDTVRAAAPFPPPPRMVAAPTFTVPFDFQ